MMNKKPTHSNCDQNAFSVNHVGYPAPYVRNPASNRLKVFVEDVYGTIDIRKQNTCGRGREYGYFWGILISTSALIIHESA